MGTPTKAEIDKWNAAVQAMMARDGITEEVAQIRLIKLLESDPVQDSIRVEVDQRLSYLEGMVAELDARVLVLEGKDEEQQFIPEDPNAPIQ